MFAIAIMMLVFGAMGFSGMSGLMTGDPTMAMGSAFAGMGIAALFAVPIALIAYGAVPDGVVVRARAGRR